MRAPSFLSDQLREFLRVKKIATLPESKQALGTTADITVFRKLKELSYPLQLLPPRPMGPRDDTARQGSCYSTAPAT